MHLFFKSTKAKTCFQKWVDENLENAKNGRKQHKRNEFTQIWRFILLSSARSPMYNNFFNSVFNFGLLILVKFSNLLFYVRLMFQSSVCIKNTCMMQAQVLMVLCDIFFAVNQLQPVYKPHKGLPSFSLSDVKFNYEEEVIFFYLKELTHNLNQKSKLLSFNYTRWILFTMADMKYLINETCFHF